MGKGNQGVFTRQGTDFASAKAPAELTSPSARPLQCVRLVEFQDLSLETQAEKKHHLPPRSGPTNLIIAMAHSKSIGFQMR